LRRRSWSYLGPRGALVSHESGYPPERSFRAPPLSMSDQTIGHELEAVPTSSPSTSSASEPELEIELARPVLEAPPSKKRYVAGRVQQLWSGPAVLTWLRAPQGCPHPISGQHCPARARSPCPTDGKCADLTVAACTFRQPSAWTDWADFAGVDLPCFSFLFSLSSTCRTCPRIDQPDSRRASASLSGLRDTAT